MAEPGDVVTVDFPGATGVKRRPAVVVSSRLYHAHRPDLVLAALTSQISAARSPTDYLLQDWQAAGLHQPTAFRAYFAMAGRSTVKPVGRLSERDWHEVQGCLARALAFQDERTGSA
ncbi:MAG TPA: type II toxin-antitoxin system PemK/MazF family toxin [Longimicrobium sp.]|jgi:mRNA interferase MazF